MDIHKPRPWHGVREFFKEYAIIVVGVLTALGAEQGAEWLHWRHEAETARDVIRRDNLRMIEWIGEFDEAGGCVDAHLNTLTDVLDKAEATGRLPPMGAMPKPPTQAWFMRGWDSAVSSGVLPHLPPGESARYAAMQYAIQTLVRYREDSTAQWAVLGSFAGAGRKLSEPEAAALRGAIQRARVDAVVIRTSADALGRMVLDGGLVSGRDVQSAYRSGVRAGAGPGNGCGPVGSAPGPRGIPTLAAPPKPPEGSYDKTVSAFRDTVAR